MLLLELPKGKIPQEGGVWLWGIERLVHDPKVADTNSVVGRVTLLSGREQAS